MKKFFEALLKTVLVLVIVGAVGWYAFGTYGPFAEQGQQLVSRFQKEAVAEDIVATEIPTEEALSEDIQQEAAEITPEISTEELTTKIVFTGDVEISEYVQSNYSAAGVDGVVSPEIKDLMTGATFTMINNEFCFSERGQKAPDKQYTFRVNPSYVSLLNDMGVDIAGLANNHVIDYGKDALTDTFTTLTNAGIEYTGAGNSLEDASKLIIKTYAHHLADNL